MGGGRQSLWQKAVGLGKDEQENRRQARRRRHLGDLAPEPLGGVVGPVQFDPAHEQLRPGMREDREDALVRQGDTLDRG